MMVASNAPIPPGIWLTKPSTIAATKIALTLASPAFSSGGIRTYIAADAHERSIIPTLQSAAARCARIGNLSVHLSRPMMRVSVPT